MNRILDKDVALIRESGLFDENWYLTEYPDVKELGMDPIVHYMRIGAQLLRDPAPVFDTKFYLESNEDLADARINPLVHYIRWGAAEGRCPAFESNIGGFNKTNSYFPKAQPSNSTSRTALRQAMAWAHAAFDAKNWQQAVARWQTVLNRFGDNDAAAGAARANISVARRLINIDTYKRQIGEYIEARATKSLEHTHSPKIAVFTAITQNYDSLKLPETLDPRFDYLLFTDSPMPNPGIYQVRPITYFHSDHTKTARYVKTHPHILLHDYDIAAWIDSNVTILGDIYPFVEDFLKSGQAVAAIPHPLRNSIYEELEACIGLNKDDAEIMREQVNHYCRTGFDHEDLIESGFMMFNLKDARVISFLDIWWREIEHYSKRDQLSLNYALKQSSIDWHSLMDRPTSLRNCPLFGFEKHGNGNETTKTLTDALEVSTVESHAYFSIHSIVSNQPGVSALSNFQRGKSPHLTPNTSEPEARSEEQLKSQARKDEIRVKLLRRKLLEIGFVKRAFRDLQDLATDTSNPYLQKLAAWELALWHANKYSRADAEQCLRYLVTVTHEEKDHGRLRQATILSAECFDILGDREAGAKVIRKTLSVTQTADLFLAVANLESSIVDRFHNINKALEQTGVSSVALEASDEKPPYDCIRPHNESRTSNRPSRSQKVSVIMPVFNAENTIQIALESILLQTWENFELLVVDDCSTDSTIDVVKSYEVKDSRTRLLNTEANQGPYIARNIGLNCATGDFVTCSDADDWSHPQKLELQALDLIANEDIVCNTSNWARMTNDLKSYRRGNPGHYIQLNISSLMFRREQFINALGSWDSVRFGADTELWMRIKKIFGDNSINELPYLLSFGRSSETSLTENSTFGYPGYPMGARREYLETYRNYQHLADTLYYPFPQRSRPFAVPEVMSPKKRRDDFSSRRFDLVLATDFRVRANAKFCLDLIAQEISKRSRIGLVQMFRYDIDPSQSICQDVRALIDGESVQLLVYGERAFANNLFVKDPTVLQETQRYVPDVKAQNVCIILDRLPVHESGSGQPIYDFESCASNLERYFGSTGLWFPTNSSIRDSLNGRFRNDVEAIRIAPEDWTDVLGLKNRPSDIQRSVETSKQNRPSDAVGVARVVQVRKECKTAIELIDVESLCAFKYVEPDGAVLLMPCIDTKVGMESAKVLVRRAGIDCKILVVHDTLRQGFIRTLNAAAERISARYIVYLAEDAYPGRNWLRSAYTSLEDSGKGLLGFNDGKWRGRIASFGMVRTEWIKTLYGGPIFYPGYIAHKADNELTVIARATNMYVYEPDCTLVEYDPTKDFGGSNRKDDNLFEQRYVQGFDGLAPLESLVEMAKEYKVKFRGIANLKTPQ